ncbi:hypothetical protein GCM10010394_31180 [Streptomyces crystallinus]|uniref:Uncharacterized protein n=1 Tax=Streptomyces crystallinus TaxID=68191 RepID=A0ABP3R4D7_9ACTN
MCNYASLAVGLSACPPPYGGPGVLVVYGARSGTAPCRGSRRSAAPRGSGPWLEGPGGQKYQRISASRGTRRYAHVPAPAYVRPFPGGRFLSGPYARHDVRRIDSPRARAAASGWCANPGRSSAVS